MEKGKKTISVKPRNKCFKVVIIGITNMTKRPAIATVLVVESPFPLSSQLGKKYESRVTRPLEIISQG